MSPADFRFSVFVKKTERTLTEQGVKQSRLIPEASILVTCIGSIGGIAIASCNCVTNQQINSVVCNDNIDDLFAYFLIQNNLFKLKELAGITTLPIINKTVFGNIELFCPTSIKEQEKIAEVLSNIDRAIEQTEAIIAKQQRIKTGLMQDLLTKGIDEAGNVRSEETHEFKDSPLGQIPVEWETKEIASVLVLPPKNGYSPPEADDWNEIYMLGLGCLTSEGFKPKQLKYAPPVNRLLEAALLQDGDFLISRSNTRALVGLVGVFKHIGEPCIYPDLMMRLRFSDSVSTEYMEQVFMSLAIRRQIENAATGTSASMVKINAAAIKNFLFRKPPIREQLRIFSILQSSIEDTLKIIVSLEKLRSLKTGLMQDLLTGKVRVTELLKDTAASP